MSCSIVQRQLTYAAASHMHAAPDCCFHFVYTISLSYSEPCIYIYVRVPVEDAEPETPAAPGNEEVEANDVSKLPDLTERLELRRCWKKRTRERCHPLPSCFLRSAAILTLHGPRSERARSVREATWLHRVHTKVSRGMVCNVCVIASKQA